jgi:hypothetical protein
MAILAPQNIFVITAIVHNTYDFNGIKGTLNSRQNVALANENFTYDNLDRLTMDESFKRYSRF